jgi:hypothetical protein
MEGSVIQMSLTSFWAAFGALITVIVVQIVVFAYRYGKLEDRVKQMEERLDKGFTCPLHNKIQEDVIRMEERANMARDIAMAVAAAKVDWEKMYKDKINGIGC